jgi:hypothetical protein
VGCKFHYDDLKGGKLRTGLLPHGADFLQKPQFFLYTSGRVQSQSCPDVRPCTTGQATSHPCSASGTTLPPEWPFCISSAAFCGICAMADCVHRSFVAAFSSLRIKLLLFCTLRDMVSLSLHLRIPENLGIAAVYITSFFYYNAAFFINVFLNHFFSLCMNIRFNPYTNGDSSTV